MKLREKNYVIVDSGDDFYIRIDYKFLGFWHTSEVLCHSLAGSPIIFGTYGGAKDHLTELNLKNKITKKKLKLLKNDSKRT